MDISTETSQIKEWRSIVTLIVFFLASMSHPPCFESQGLTKPEYSLTIVIVVIIVLQTLLCCSPSSSHCLFPYGLFTRPWTV